MKKLDIYERGSLKKKFNLLNVENYGSLNYISVQHVLCSLLTSLKYSGGVYFIKLSCYPGGGIICKEAFIQAVIRFFQKEFFAVEGTPFASYISVREFVCQRQRKQCVEVVLGIPNVNPMEVNLLRDKLEGYMISSSKFWGTGSFSLGNIRWLPSHKGISKVDRELYCYTKHVFASELLSDLDLERHVKNLFQDYFLYQRAPFIIIHACLPNLYSLFIRTGELEYKKKFAVLAESLIFDVEHFNIYRDNGLIACNFFPNIFSIPNLAKSDLSKFYYLVANYFYYKKYLFLGFNFSILYGDDFSIKSTKKVIRKDLVLMDKYFTKSYSWQYGKGYILDLYEKLFIKGNHTIDTTVFSYMSILPNLHLFEEEVWPKIKYIRAFKYFMWNCLQFIMLSYTLILVITQISFFIVGHDLSHIYFTFFLITFFLHLFLDFFVYIWNYPTEEKFTKYVENYVSNRFSINSSRNELWHNVHYYFNKLRYLLKGLNINPTRVVLKNDRYLGQTQRLEKMYLALEKSSPSLLVNGVLLDIKGSKTVKGKIVIKKKRFSS